MKKLNIKDWQGKMRDRKRWMEIVKQVVAIYPTKITITPYLAEIWPRNYEADSEVFYFKRKTMSFCNFSNLSLEELVPNFSTAPCTI